MMFFEKSFEFILLTWIALAVNKDGRLPLYIAERAYREELLDVAYTIV
jgi:hypothetical protein